MCSLIEWLNSNEGFAMCLLTFAYVVATIIIIVLNKKTITEMQQGRQEESRPYLMASFVKDPRDKCFFIRIKNYGKTGAIITRLNITPDLKLVESTGGKIDLAGSLFPPEYMLQIIVLEEWEKTCEKEYHIEISYDSLETSVRHFTDEYKLGLQYAHLQGYSNTKRQGYNKTENELANIADIMDSIRNKI